MKNNPTAPSGHVGSSDLLDSLEHLCATVYMGRDWHALAHNERLIVARLEAGGYLTPSKNGFVGWMPERPKPSANLEDYCGILSDESNDEVCRGSAAKNESP